VWRSFKEGESLAGKCGLVHSTEKRPVSGSGCCCILDVTVTCSYGVESKQQNKIKAQDGVDIISPHMEKQQRRSSIVHGQSIKLGCSYKVIFKQWDSDSALYLIVSHGKHTNQAGVSVHEGQGLARISEECKHRAYEGITNLTAPKAIVAGARASKCTEQ
jgi:hypothetical protein